ncbi:MAG: hypothetical protein COB54_06625 [Alphaproteobacteria bacterium]|nr:MAG: hypothetical protein COB54_06625 [Alphaproteobacteria bacterium]
MMGVRGNTALYDIEDKLKIIIDGALMTQKFTQTLVLVLSCFFLVSCGGERRVDGEMPFDSSSLMNMAESFLQAGDYGNAMRLYQRAANENPQHIPSRLGLAKTYQALGATDAAINFYEQVLRLDPNNMDAKMGSGQMLITKNRPADAIPYLTGLSGQDPKNYRIFNMLGLAHDLMGQQEEAQMNYGRGLTLAADNISVLNNLALSFAFEEQYAPAIKLLSKAINLDYTVTKAQHNLVLVYVLSGEEDAAREIGDSIMTREEMETNIARYRWVKSLSPGQRAQAIFLGIKNFPGQAGKAVLSGGREQSGREEEIIPDDPKKRQLQELLKQEVASSSPRTQNTTENPLGNSASDSPETPSPILSDARVQKAVKKPSEKVYRVQLGSYPNPKLARSGWAKIGRRSKDILEPYEPLVKLVTLANGKNLFRLFVGSIEEKMLARTVCDDLRDRNVDCLVLKTSKD